MKIEQLDTSTILVTLAEEDMRDYRLCLEDSADSGETKRGLMRLLVRVGQTCGLDHRGKSYLIEALPAREGCLLIISVRTAKRRRVYRIKRDTRGSVWVFDDADAMLDWLCADSRRTAYAIWLYRGRYILLPPLSMTQRDCVRLSEYGREVRADAVAVARIKEFGEPVRI